MAGIRVRKWFMPTSMARGYKPLSLTSKRGILLLSSLISCFVALAFAEPCKISDFTEQQLACDPSTRLRKTVFYLANKCDVLHPDSVRAPQPFEVPCECKPGYGLQGDSRGMECVKCRQGTYGTGGEILDEFSNWNGTKGIPGSGYNMYLYCNDFLTTATCNPWRPEGNNRYLVSGDFKNSTTLRCFEQSIIDTMREFVQDENYIQFDFKVDGAPCRKGVSVCTNGLKFFIDGKEMMHIDQQFQWVTIKYIVAQGIRHLKWVYYRSCTREQILDVAYIRHIILAGSAEPTSQCVDCPPGSHSDQDGAQECLKCDPGEYQDKSGQRSCVLCKPGEYSRFGFTKCLELPTCTRDDYFVLPKRVSECYKSNGKWMRDTIVDMAKWPAFNHLSCAEDRGTTDPNLMRPTSEPTSCLCQPGYFINTKSSKTFCERCAPGTFSEGNDTECRGCPEGSVAVPGFYYRDWSQGGLPEGLKEECSGRFCDANIWEPRGKFLATRRLPGNFEVKLSIDNILINYPNAKIEYNCSLDCRLFPSGDALAKHTHCFLHFVLMKDGISVQERSCVNEYRPQLRNGTEQYHVIPITDAGNYSLIAIFHHEDEANMSLLSYEARIHYIDITGPYQGVSRECLTCPAGTFVSLNRSFCQLCPNGTFSDRGANTCTRCPKGTFASVEGSAECSPCGSGTQSNENGDGCQWNGCKFQAADDLVYDLSPLSLPGGPMREVKSHDKGSGFYYPLLYYVNLCTYEHDNSSCTSSVRKLVDGQLEVVDVKFLRTMACKRWSFDNYHSYSIGEVLSYFPLDNAEPHAGLQIHLDKGYKCWDKTKRSYVDPKTKIWMLCDLAAGEGYPEPRSNESAIDAVPCEYHLRWRSMYACPVCPAKVIFEVRSDCTDGQQVVTYSSKYPCRLENGTLLASLQRRIPCAISAATIATSSATRPSSLTATTRNNEYFMYRTTSPTTPLIVTTVVALAFIILLLILLVYFVRRNRHLRGRIFAPGKTFSQVKNDDQDELVDNMM